MAISPTNPHSRANIKRSNARQISLNQQRITELYYLPSTRHIIHYLQHGRTGVSESRAGQSKLQKNNPLITKRYGAIDDLSRRLGSTELLDQLQNVVAFAIFQAVRSFSTVFVPEIGKI